MRSTIHIRSIILLIANLNVILSHAQETKRVAAPSPLVPTGTPEYLLISFAAILLITIVVLGQVLVRLTTYTSQHKSKSAQSILFLLILSVCGYSLMAQDVAPIIVTSEVISPVSDIFSINIMAAYAVILIEIFVIMILVIRIWALMNIINPQAQKQKLFVCPPWLARFNESLSPAGKYSIILIICCSSGYLLYFYIREAHAEKYKSEMAAAKTANEAYLIYAKNNVDESTVVYDKSYIAEGEKVYVDNCVACHGGKGEGGVGPNLTDHYWLHGGKISDIFKTVKYGSPANGMKSWQTELTAIQMAQVACYVKSLEGTNPENPKNPQGELYTENVIATTNNNAK